MSKAAPRDGFGEALVTLGEQNPRVVVLTADLAESTRCAAFADRFPDRFFQLGVAEQNLVGVAVGLAEEGWIPFATSFAAFVPGRVWDQLRVSVCYNRANVKLIGSHAGLSAGPDGATHQMLEDLALTRVLPNLTVLAPADAFETRAATVAAAAYQGPVYLRMSRAPETIVTAADQKFTIGRAVSFSKGDDLTVATTGSMLQPTVEALRHLGRRVRADHWHFPTVKPLDRAVLLDSVRRTRAVVTVEEGQAAGGFGSAVAEAVSESRPVPVRRVGVADQFGRSGETGALRTAYHLAASDIEAAIIATLIAKNA